MPIEGIIMDAFVLKNILDLHSKWLKGEDGGVRADLHSANLRSAKFNSATKWPAPTMVLLANWGEVSDTLCLALMRFDCANHPDGPKRFDEWVKTGRCPYDNSQFQRSVNFLEKKNLWKRGLSKSAINLVKMLLKEKCVEEK